MYHIIRTSQSYIMCCLASTSAIEANHARLITRGLHHKGRFLFEIRKMTILILRSSNLCHEQSLRVNDESLLNNAEYWIWRHVSVIVETVKPNKFKGWFSSFYDFHHFDSLFENFLSE